jgi:uncharacterized protein (DUF302 family)
MTYGNAIALDRPYSTVVEEVRAALKDQGFGVLTEIDVQATMREKLGQETGPYVILGACNPPLAFQALSADRSVGLLLPCNVVVREDGGRTIVEAVDPAVMLQVADAPALAAVAADAGKRLAATLEALAAR